MIRVPLWTKMLHAGREQKVGLWVPAITDFYLHQRENEDKEWMTPPEWDFVIFHYQDSKYTINRDWEIKWLKREIMKYMFYWRKRWPRIRIQILKKDAIWNFKTITKELNILNLMEKNFWKYIIWYWKKIGNPEKYILVPKDWDYNNLSYKNLQYIKKEDYYKYKRKSIVELALTTWKTTKEIAKLLWTSAWYVRTVLNESWKSQKLKAYQELQEKIWIEFSEDNYEIYKILIECKWKLSNMEVAKKIRWKKLLNTEDKSYYTDKIVRARKKLTSKWIIPRYNENFESKRWTAIEMIESGMTAREIAEALWLKPQQVYNLRRKQKNKD